jgi:hypothetical protein
MFNPSIVLDIARFGIKFEGGENLIDLIELRYQGFRSSLGHKVSISLVELPELDSEYAQQPGYIPEIRYLKNGFEIEMAPYFKIEFDEKRQAGTLYFTKTPRKVAPQFKEAFAKTSEASPLPFGIRRGIGTLFTTLLAQDEAPTLHAAGVQIGQQGIVAPGESNTGKTTFFGMFPEPNQLNDEFIVIRNDKEFPEVFSTPFSSGWDAPRLNRSAPLKTLLELIQSPQVCSALLSQKDILRIMTQNSVLPLEASRECSSNFKVFYEVSKAILGHSLKFSLNADEVTSAVSTLVRSSRA